MALHRRRPDERPRTPAEWVCTFHAVTHCHCVHTWHCDPVPNPRNEGRTWSKSSQTRCVSNSVNVTFVGVSFVPKLESSPSAFEAKPFKQTQLFIPDRADANSDRLSAPVRFLSYVCSREPCSARRDETLMRIIYWIRWKHFPQFPGRNLHSRGYKSL